MFAIFSDIHANLTALQACYRDLLSRTQQAKIIILGDYIDYGPRPNETIQFINAINPYIVLKGNHEEAVLTDQSARFSSQRGIESASYTKSILTEESAAFIKKSVGAKDTVGIKDKKILLVHGDLSDIYWGKMPYAEMQNAKYKDFDYVISGHTHVPHLVEQFYDLDSKQARGKKKTIFLNPGSIGQPRNHCRHAQYLLADIEKEEFYFCKVEYDIEKEQQFFGNKIDVFYKERLSFGI